MSSDVIVKLAERAGNGPAFYTVRPAERQRVRQAAMTTGERFL